MKALPMRVRLARLWRVLLERAAGALGRARRSPEGADIWCCLRRGMRPQTPIEERWRKAGVWAAELEALPARALGACG